MKLAREKFGHFIPPPNFLHTAVWVGPYGSNNQTLGSILSSFFEEYFPYGSNNQTLGSQKKKNRMTLFFL